MKIKGKIFSSIVAVMSVVSIGTAVNAATPNTSDTDFFNHSNVTVDYTDTRDKNTSSSCYMYYEAGNAATIRAEVYHYSVNCTNKCSYNGYKDYYTVSRYTERGLENTVRESGYTNCRLKTTTASNKYASGVWSPDMVGEYH